MPVAMVPTEVKTEETTFEAREVPVKVPAGATTTFVEAAVTRPLPLTVMVGIAVDEPKAPTFELTVARVVTDDPAEVLMSPVKAGSCEGGNVFSVAKAPNGTPFVLVQVMTPPVRVAQVQSPFMVTPPTTPALLKMTCPVVEFVMGRAAYPKRVLMSL